MPRSSSGPSPKSEVPPRPGWEPHDVTLRVYVTRRFSLALERVAADLRLSKSLLVREAVRRGLPALVNDVQYLRSQGYRPSAHLAGSSAASARRGSFSDPGVSARWSKLPGDFSEEPRVPPPVVDDD